MPSNIRVSVILTLTWELSSIATTTYLLAWVKAIFPEFEFSWLADEMRQNLPLEMDFNHEAQNAARATADFAHLRKTTLYIPKVLQATKRTLVMEFIEGGRVDDLEYLQERTFALPTFVNAD